jgi:hypothetical protein
MTVIGIYATLDVLLLLASRDPRAHLSLSRRQVERHGRARSPVKEELIFRIVRAGASQDRRLFDGGQPEIGANDPKRAEAALQRDGRLRGESLLVPG